MPGEETGKTTRIKVKHKRGKRKLKVQKGRMSSADIQSRYEEHLRRVNEGGK